MRGVAVIAAASLAAIVAIGFTQARSLPVERHAYLSLPGWPRDAPALRIALLSDIHAGGWIGTPARFAAVMAAVDRAHPDLVLLAGDFVNGHAGDDVSVSAAMLVSPLRTLTPRLGMIAVLGNHDHWTSRTIVTRALRRAGATVLVNAAVRRGPLTVVGIDDDFSGHADPGRAIARTDAPMLALSHSPDVALRLPRGVPTLAGHTHCGQVVLPVVGAAVRHSPMTGRRLYDARMRCGMIDVDGHRVVVTAGVGSGSFPMRIGAPPDWWLLTVGR